MARLLVGDPDCTYSELILMFDEPTIATVIITEWTSLARRLDTPPDIIEKHRKGLLLQILTHSDVVEKLLVEWRLRKSKEATLGSLYQKIPASMQLLKDKLQEKIREKAKCWDNLDDDSKQVILNTNVQFLGRTYTLASLRDMMNNEKFEEVMNNPNIKEYLSKSFEKKDWDLGLFEIPKRLPYYIQRRLTQQRRLNPTIFKHKCLDIFLIEGIEHHHLSILVRPELTDVSSDQMKKVTRRFILLEHPDDYEKIIKIAKSPVHRIKHEDNQFFWVSTSGSCQMIRLFLISDPEEIEETNFIKEHLSIFNNRPFAICSSPGMGKSVFLANLAHLMIDCYLDRIVIFLELRSLIPKLSSEIDSENVRNILLSCPTISSIGKEFLSDLLQSKRSNVEIFLDGFDEISTKNSHHANKFLECLLKFTNMRVYMTSRPHMRNEIENIFEVISLDIASFNLENQRNFLLDFWTSDQNIINCDKLSEFATRVLESLEFINQDTSQQTEFAGIPLQCFMLAKIYRDDAKLYSTRDNFNFQPTNSLHEMYFNFMKLKFERIDERERKLVKLFHVKEALILLFPDSQIIAQVVQELTRKGGLEDFPREKIFSAGILDYASNKPSFLHRTFAEYLVAEFIVEELMTNEFADMGILVKFVIEDVLHVHTSPNGRILEETDIDKIQDFIESSETWSTGKLDLKNLKAVLLSHLDIPLESVMDDLFQIFICWLYKTGSKATIDALLRALKFLGWTELSDDILKEVLSGNNVLLHEMVCYFVDAALGKSEEPLILKKLSHFEEDKIVMTRDCGKLEDKLLMCTRHGYQFLTQTLVEFYRRLSIFNNAFIVDIEMCKDLLLRTCAHDNVEFFEYIWDTVKSFQDFNFTEYFKTISNNDKVFGQSPLSVSISTGNYKVVEYLINCIGDDSKGAEDAWLACFVNCWKDSANVISNKVKILRLLHKSEHNFQIEKLKEAFPNGFNLVLLTTLYDLCDFTPTESDVEYIISSVFFFCRNNTEMDILVYWLLSNNLVHLLTHDYESPFSLISQAIVKNVLRPETLSRIYKKYSFDLGIIFNCAVVCKQYEAILKTIIQLSGDVNLKDKLKNTLLHWAACFRRINVIRLLIDHGADVNSRNAFGNTPIHNVFRVFYSSENFHSIHDIVHLLIENGASVCAKNVAGIPALELANAMKEQMCIDERTLELLESAVQNKSSQESCSSELLEDSMTVSQLLDHDEFHIAFQDAFIGKCLGLFLQKLVRISGNVNISNHHKTTLLHDAALYGAFEAMEYLLKSGADPNSKDNDGDNPLHYVFDSEARNCYYFTKPLNKNTEWIHDCVQLLLKHNANVNEINKKGDTVLDRVQLEMQRLKIEDRTLRLLVTRSQDENEVD